MRCTNCGWPNKPGAMECEKCHIPLGVDQEDDIRFQPKTQDPPHTANLNKTVLESDIFGEINQLKHEDTLQCPKCGYPMRAGSQKCPNCNFSVRTESPTINSEKNFNKPKRPIIQHSAVGDTVNPYLMMDYEPTPSFTLRPIQKANERKSLDTKEMQGKEIILTRDNTEPDNPFITSKEQAIVTYNDGKWFIEDHSEQKTTFVQASHKIELHDGDSILLGNRLFEFHKQD